MGTEALTIRSDSKKVKQLDMLASQMDRSRSYLVNQAIDQLLELHTWQIDRTIEGIEAAEDQARAILFLASDLAGYVNGVNLLADGGFTAATQMGQVDLPV